MESEFIIIIGKNRTIAGTPQHAILLNVLPYHQFKMSESIHNCNLSGIKGSYGIIAVIAIVHKSFRNSKDNSL